MSDDVEKARAESSASAGADGSTTPSLSDPTRRGPGEWLVIALLIVLIGFVAWKQFGSLFSEPEASGDGPQHLQMGSDGEAVSSPGMADPDSADRPDESEGDPDE